MFNGFRQWFCCMQNTFSLWRCSKWKRLSTNGKMVCKFFWRKSLYQLARDTFHLMPRMVGSWIFFSQSFKNVHLLTDQSYSTPSKEMLSSIHYYWRPIRCIFWLISCGWKTFNCDPTLTLGAPSQLRLPLYWWAAMKVITAVIYSMNCPEKRFHSSLDFISNKDHYC